MKSPRALMPFTPGWWSFDLGELRPCEGTYELYAPDAIPPLTDAPRGGDFAWLREAAGRPDAVYGEELAALRSALKELGLDLPAAFSAFMADAALQDAVPSCTACEWDLGLAPVPSPVEPGAHTVRFLRDQQDCLFWYLYLVPGRTPVVLCSPLDFDDEDAEHSAAAVLEDTVVVADDFESFVYRWWLENELWELVNDDPEDEDLTPAQAAYLAFYRARS